MKQHVLGNNKDIIVAGASHSGFSALGKLLEAFDAEDGFNGQITVFTRKRPRVYYPSPADALMDKAEYTADDVNRKNRVNEFGGLRGDAAELFNKIDSRQEPRVVIDRVDDIADAVSERPGEHVIVQALGYIPRVIPVYDDRGRRIGPFVDDRGRIVTTDQAQLRDLQGNVMPNAYAIGHGHSLGLMPNLHPEQSFTGSFENVYYFQGDFGNFVARGLAA